MASAETAPKTETQSRAVVASGKVHESRLNALQRWATYAGVVLFSAAGIASLAGYPPLYATLLALAGVTVVGAGMAASKL